VVALRSLRSFAAISHIDQAYLTSYSFFVAEDS
jgi:hypothetical protein